MKKIILFVILFCFSFSLNTFAYSPTAKDTKTLNSVFKQIDLIYEKQPEKVEKLYDKISKILPSLKKDNQTKYIILWLYNYILYKKESNLNLDNTDLNTTIELDTDLNKNENINSTWAIENNNELLYSNKNERYCEYIDKDLLDWENNTLLINNRIENINELIKKDEIKERSNLENYITLKSYHNEIEWIKEINSIRKYVINEICYKNKNKDIERVYDILYRYNKKNLDVKSVDFSISELQIKKDNYWKSEDIILTTIKNVNEIESRKLDVFLIDYNNIKTELDNYVYGNYLKDDNWECYYINNNWIKSYVEDDLCE